MFRSIENCVRRVFEGGLIVSDTRRNVVEVCSMAFNLWYLAGTDELFLIVNRLKRGAFVVLTGSPVRICKVDRVFSRARRTSRRIEFFRLPR